jgi:hypothetical protein
VGVVNWLRMRCKIRMILTNAEQYTGLLVEALCENPEIYFRGSQ